MKIIKGDRQTGKTTKLIELCNKENGVLVVMNNVAKGCVEDYVRKHNYNILVKTMYEVKNGGLRGVRKPVYVDDVDMFLEEIMGGEGIRCIAITGE